MYINNLAEISLGPSTPILNHSIGGSMDIDEREIEIELLPRLQYWHLLNINDDIV